MSWDAKPYTDVAPDDDLRGVPVGGAGARPHVLPGRALGDMYLIWLSAVLMGYAFFGKGAAYIGYRPLYISEVTLLFALMALSLTRAWGPCLTILPFQLLLAFCAWGAIRTFPYLGTHGVDALRDGVLWGYGVFAIAVTAMLIMKPIRLVQLLQRYDRFVRLFITCIIIFWVASELLGRSLPQIPGTEIEIIDLKAGDILVHLGGAAAFLIVGLGSANTFSMIMLAGTFVVTAVKARAGMLAFLVAFSVASYFRPSSVRAWRIVAVLLFGAALLAMSNFSIRISDRLVSFDQVVENVFSIFESQGGGNLAATKRWRLVWWGDIIDYTFDGRYFWLGKGYGINLADSDGFQVKEDSALRSPHNAHMTVLARSGVPGFAIWIAMHLSWLFAMARVAIVSRRNRDTIWMNVALFLVAYWCAFMVNASFDVYFENPMGGIWFWTVFGVGMAVAYLHKHRPETLRPSAQIIS